MKIALVHDYLNQYGGAERVLKALCELFGEAPIFTLFYDENRTNHEFAKRKIITSFLQRLPGVAKHHQLFPLLMPLAVERLDLRGYDLVISDSESFGKGVILSPDTIHISYCHTPARFLWDGSQRYLNQTPLPRAAKPFIPFALTYLRLWDWEASKRVHRFLANSRFVAERIKKYYRREAKMIYPPVAISDFGNLKAQKQDYYLLLMRLVPYKRPEIVIEAFNELGLPLKVIGDGPLLPHLKLAAKPNVEFIEPIPHAKVGEYYKKAKALLFPQEEDFGISAVEACASGTPVIAYKGGGALETIRQGVNGIFFPEQTPQSVIRAVRDFQKMTFDDNIVRASVKKFNEERFKSEVRQFINSVMKN
ncbi:MAG: glycosyltransferase [Candidatus Portnoybacteria bacterium]|nr:glycosyltransferase [Candidatus Portnoybacteria bacterium]